VQAKPRWTRRFRYAAYGLTLDSDAPLPELAATQGRSSSAQLGQLRIRLRPPHAHVGESRELLLETALPDGQPWMQASRLSRGYLLRYVGLVDFVVNLTGTEIALAHAEKDISHQTLGHLLLDQALPMVLGLRGIPTLHASTVVTSQGACAFLGPAGSGKSTLAASFSGAGFRVLGDDCLALRENGGYFAIPAYPGFRLWMDSAKSLSTGWLDAPAVAHYTRKRRIISSPAVESFPENPEPLRVIYCLARDTANNPTTVSLKIEPLRRSDAFMRLISASFVIDVTSRAALARNHRFIERLLKGVAVRLLRIPNSFSALAEVREAVLDDLDALALS
jgi:hypothetical protein